jgi:phage-related protein
VPGRDLKPVHWIGSARRDLKAFPREVQRSMGYALFRAQEGKKAPTTKPLKGITTGAGILEAIEDHQGDTYRVVYTVRFSDTVYVLHSFQKKSKKGIATPKHEIALIRERYEAARAHHDRWRKDQ